MDKQEQTRPLALPEDVLDRIDRRLPHTEFDTAEEYVTYVLEELLANVEDADGEEFDSADEAEVRDRLESLGYLDE